MVASVIDLGSCTPCIWRLHLLGALARPPRINYFLIGGLLAALVTYCVPYHGASVRVGSTIQPPIYALDRTAGWRRRRTESTKAAGGASLRCLQNWGRRLGTLSKTHMLKEGLIKNIFGKVNQISEGRNVPESAMPKRMPAGTASPYRRPRPRPSAPRHDR